MKKFSQALLVVTSIAASTTSHASPNAPSAAPDTLSAVLSTKQLRVCSPGDYKPFSFDNNGKFEGLDNDLINGLAKSLNANVTMVKTSWPTLMADFKSGKCDIAVGGISITLARQQQVLFSEPYFTNGKTPLVRCGDVQKYQTVDQINQPHVRIISNPGGSNENYARTVLSRAKLTMHPDNLTVFDEVANGNVDVFVHEAAEGIIKSQEYKGVLCSVNPDKPLKPELNGWMIADNDFRFKAYVDQFLRLEKLSGNLDKTINHWLPKN